VSSFSNPPHYQVYLLRFWQERDHLPETAMVWRFSLEDPHTGERRGFADLPALQDFLAVQVEASAVVAPKIEAVKEPK